MATEQVRNSAQRRSPAAEQILATASELFFLHGIRAVGVDTIAAESGVTKMTLYKHFGSKDGLVAEYLLSRDHLWRARWKRAIDRGGEPMERLLAVFDAYERSIVDDDFRGCAFVNAAAELPDLAHPAREVVYEHKAAMRHELTTLAESAGLDSPPDVAEEIMVLLEGAFITASIRQDPTPLRRARDMAKRLTSDHACG